MQQIPGYEWDAARRRYFKILKTGEMPQGKYTVAALAHQARQTERRRIGQREDEKRAEAAIFGAPSHVKRTVVGTKAQNAAVARSETPVAAFDVYDRRVVVGHRDGIISDSTKSPTGRSIVAIEFSPKGELAAAGVDSVGSVVATPTTSTHIPGFVAALAWHGGSAVAGHTTGLTFCQNEPEFVPLGAVSALSTAYAVLAGCRNGTILRYDPESNDATEVFRYPNDRAVTNLVAVDPHVFVSTGLEDQMYIHDLRAQDSTRIAYSNWSNPHFGAALSPDGYHFAVAQDPGIRIHDLRSPHTELREVSSASAIRWTRDGLFFATKNRVKVLSKRRFVSNSGDSTSLSQQINQLST